MGDLGSRSETRGLFVRVGSFQVWGVVLDIKSLDCGEILGSEGGTLGMLDINLRMRQGELSNHLISKLAWPFI